MDPTPGGDVLGAGSPAVCTHPVFSHQPLAGDAERALWGGLSPVCSCLHPTTAPSLQGVWGCQHPHPAHDGAQHPYLVEGAGERHLLTRHPGHPGLAVARGLLPLHHQFVPAPKAAQHWAPISQPFPLVLPAPDPPLPTLAPRGTPGSLRHPATSEDPVQPPHPSIPATWPWHALPPAPEHPPHGQGRQRTATPFPVPSVVGADPRHRAQHPLGIA